MLGGEKMHPVVLDTIQLNIENFFYETLKERNFTDKVIDKILASTKEHGYCSIVNEIAQYMEENYSFYLNDDINVIGSAAYEEAEEWLKNNESKFDEFIDKQIEI